MNRMMQGKKEARPAGKVTGFTVTVQIWIPYLAIYVSVTASVKQLISAEGRHEDRSSTSGHEVRTVIGLVSPEKSVPGLPGERCFGHDFSV